MEHEEGRKKDKAQQLFDKYNKAIEPTPDPLDAEDLEGPRIDRKLARRWERERTRKQIYLHNPVVNGIVCGTIICENFNVETAPKKRHREEEEDLKRTRINRCQSINQGKTPDYYQKTFVSSEVEKNTLDKEIDDFFRAGSYHKRLSFNEIKTSSTDYDYVDEKTTNDKSNTSPIEADLVKFQQAYLAMDPDRMWTLKTGTKVETVVYEFAKDLRRESYLHSFIINDADAETRSLFSPEEWKEIRTFKAKEKPKLDPCHKNLLKKYTTNDIRKLRSLLFESFTPDGKEYNRNDHFCLDYINNAYRGILRLWEMDNNPFDSSKSEGWFAMNIWSRLIDPALDDLNVNLIRGEGMSFASSERKNAVNTYKKFGRKGDGVFRLPNSRLEVGAIEAGRKYKEKSGTKLLSDSLKLSKMLKDMMDKLIKECGTKEGLKVIGILNGANRLQVLTVDRPKGYVTRMNHNNIQEVAGRLTNTKPLALVLKEILYVRSIITATMYIIDKHDLDIDTFLDDDGYHTPRQTCIL
ncbi:1427_t:CDS:2 [Paraglomus occultum]|uniref:1427_t:CDS:1 n=1 Tax=Paraglomus occultum TaxID=144539 RepID=A0A9N9BKW1_9GLOM|nr:1427_t:CDS:2 [Paraglomus occultum]